MKAVRPGGGAYGRGLSPTKTPGKDAGSDPDSRGGSFEEVTPKKDLTELDSFLLRLPLTHAVMAQHSLLSDPLLFSPTRLRRLSVAWKYGALTAVSAALLLLCSLSLARHAGFLRLLAALPRGPMAARHVEQAPPLGFTLESRNLSSEEGLGGRAGGRIVTMGAEVEGPSHLLSELRSGLIAEAGSGNHTGGKKAYQVALESCPPLAEVAYGEGSGIGRHYPYPKKYHRQECQCTAVHNFVILSMQRSGSGWFETLLNSHPNVSSHGEVFSRQHRRRNATIVARRLDSVYNLDWNNSAAKNSCTSAVGLKWMLNQGVMEFRPQVLEYFQRHQVSVLLLLRRNVLRRLVSILANAHDRKTRGEEHKAHTHDSDEARKLAEFRPSLNTRHLVANLQRVQETLEEALQAFNGTRLKVLFYEDVLRNRTILEDVQRFLGVPVQELSSQHIKIHTKPFNETVENYSQVAAALNGTVFQRYLEDDEDSKMSD